METATLNATESGAPGCKHCEFLVAERNFYRSKLVEMAYPAGWPEHPVEHVRELQREANRTLATYSPFRGRDPKPFHAPPPPIDGDVTASSVRPRLSVRVLRSFSTIWLNLAAVFIIGSYAVIWVHDGHARLAEIADPFNFWNFAAVIVTLAPGLLASYYADKLAAKKPITHHESRRLA